MRLAASLLVAVWMICGASGAFAQKPPLLPEHDVAVLANELSGETAKRNLEVIATFHRQRGSAGFHSAAELVADRLRTYGLSDVAILQFPADGKIFYGTQRSRPAWDAEVGELNAFAPLAPAPCGGEAPPGIIADCVGGPRILHESYDAEPVVLAEDSDSAHVIAKFADVGAGTKESDYDGKDVRGSIVLVSAQPGAVQDLAVGKFGAVGIVSYAQNQKTAWSGENQDAIRWGHLETFSVNKTFAFMISLKTARELQEHIKAGGVLADLVVKAGQHPGNYEVVTATIPGADPKLKAEEIAFSCHLDHQRPGANDNASGCVAILEVARTLQKLIDEKKLARPARTIRFIFPPEVEGTMALLNARPEFAARIKAVIHMDMVGGGPETKAVFHVTRGPMSLPSFVHDVAWAFADWVNEQSYKFAATGSADFPMVAPEGGKEPLRAEYSPFSMGSDHEVYQDSSFAIPAIYLNDWPDRYIHTDFDTAANIDPTKLKRVAFIGAASAYFLAGMKVDDQKAVESEVTVGRFMRDVSLREKTHGLAAKEVCPPMQQQIQYEVQAVWSIRKFLELADQKPEIEKRIGNDCIAEHGPFAGHAYPRKYLRKTQPKGPLTVFGYDYFIANAKVLGVTPPKLLGYEGLWGGGDEYAYEILNFANGKLNAWEIWDAVSAEYGPVPIDLVTEYLTALVKIGVVEEVP